MLTTILNKDTQPVWAWPEKPDPEIWTYSNLSFYPEGAGFVPAGIVGRTEPFHKGICSVATRILSVPNLILPTHTDALDNTTGLYTSVIMQGRQQRMVWMPDYVLSHTLGDPTSWPDISIFNNGYIPFNDPLTLNRSQIVNLIESYFNRTTIVAHGRAVIATVDDVSEVVVAASFITADSNILVTGQDETVSGTVREAREDRVVGQSFTLRSTNLFDNGAVSWIVLQV